MKRKAKTKIIKVMMPGRKRKDGTVGEPYVCFREVKHYPELSKAEAKKIHQKRSKIEKSMDMAKTSKKITSTTRYLRNPGRFDYIGVDTKNAQGTKKQRKHEDFFIFTNWINKQARNIYTKDVPTYILKLAKKYGWLYSGVVYKGINVKTSKELRKIPIKKNIYISLKPVYSSWADKMAGAAVFFAEDLIGTVLLKSTAKNGIDVVKAYKDIFSPETKKSMSVEEWKKLNEMMTIGYILEREHEIIAKITKAKIIDMWKKK